MRPIAIDYAPALTPQQVEKLNKFFHDVDEGKRGRAIHCIDRGVAVFNAMQSGDDKPNVVKAAKQVTRIKTAIHAAIEELNSLLPDTVETFNNVATNKPNFQEIACAVTGRRIIDQLHHVHSLCFWALEDELPRVGKKGRGRNTDDKAKKRLAADILEAYAVAYDLEAKRLDADDTTDVDEIYKILSMKPPSGILRKIISIRKD